MFKPTVDAEDNKEKRADKGWAGRQRKRVALVDRKRAYAHQESQLEPLTFHHEESQEELQQLASFHRKMEEDREELEKGMAAAQLPPLPDDSWELEEENGEESGSMHAEDMMGDCELSEEEEWTSQQEHAWAIGHSLSVNRS
jgi:hypothetical protein